jgi:uncharacterized protein (DUF1501 family)
MTLSRRTFLTSGLGLLSLYLSPSELFEMIAPQAAAQPRAAGNKVLVVVQLGGGNDGLNTVVPYGNGSYYQARPNLAIAQDQVLALNGQIGLNPNLKGIAQLYGDGKVAIIQSVGYPSPNRSHFRSMEIWQTAEPTKIADRGWLGKYLDFAVSGDQGKNNFPAINVDAVLPKSLTSAKVAVPSVNSVYDFRFKTDPRYMEDRRAQIAALTEIYKDFSSPRPNSELLRQAGLEARESSDYLLKVVRNYKGSVQYPKDNFAENLKFISQMITGGVNSRIYTVSLDGFDTHTNQTRTQTNLLKHLSDALYAFQTDLQMHGVDKDVVTLVFSEFGRRVSENGGRGTDHGTAGPVFIIGSSVKGGIYGDSPVLSSLDDGDLRYRTDFRTVYATILDRWLDADSRQILGANYGDLALFNT